jgi:protein-tyrosine phosphatase
MRILFVCLGNICRSPTAEGVLRHKLAAAGLDGEVEVESAGTGDWHVGNPPDRRATEAAAERGIVLAGSAQQIEAFHFDDFDLILAMDRQNLADLRLLAPDAEAGGKLHLFREFDPLAAESGDLEVPDPYFGGADGFEEVLDMVERASDGLIAEIRSAPATGA